MPQQIRIFFRLVFEEWSSRVTGSLSAMLVLLGLGISIAGSLGAKIPADSVIQLATWMLAAICGGQAAYSVWSREHNARKAAEAKLTPQLRIVYDPTVPPCKSPTTFSDGTRTWRAMCFRLQVENVGEQPVDNCEGYLTECRNINDPFELGPTTLTWSDQLRLVKGVKRYLDILNISDTNRISIATPGFVWPIDRQDMFTKPGEYLFKIVVHGDNTATLPPYALRLHFTGDWRTSTMEPG